MRILIEHQYSDDVAAIALVAEADHGVLLIYEPPFTRYSRVPRKGEIQGFFGRDELYNRDFLGSFESPVKQYFLTIGQAFRGDPNHEPTMDTGKSPSLPAAPIGASSFVTSPEGP